MTKQIGIILLASAVVAVVANCVNPRRIPWVQDWSHQVEGKAAEHRIGIISLSVALDKFKAGKSVFVDARSTNDYAKGHIPGAVSVPFESLDKEYATIEALVDSGKELVIYCTNRECDDGLLLAKEMQAMGYSNLVLYVDGFELWRKQGGPVESGDGAGAGGTPAVHGASE